jgi:molybdopterin-guanine dinucleotide biosynthesis protein A
MSKRTVFNGYVLAGGDSRRFGADKALHPIDGRPMIDHPIQVLDDLCNRVELIVKRPALYAHLGVPIREDLVARQTPLAGVLTALKSSDTEWNFVLACDLPAMAPYVLRRLACVVNFGADRRGASGGISSSLGRELQAVVPRTPAGLQPLSALYARSAIEALEEAVAANRSMKEWLADITTCPVPFRDSPAFQNVNWRNDLPASLQPEI